MLNEFYKQKIQQIHIVGEYANLMVRDYDAALQYVQDYFQADYKLFVAKYFKGERVREIERNLTPQKYEQLFKLLSKTQMEIISDKESHCIVVAAGPGSGKTRVLVHKLASLLLLEDVKHEQLLMLTFSRAAATEFKQRLMELIGNAAHFVEIKTFHSYCFDLLGKVGNLDESKDVVARAAQMINNGEVEPNRIGKTVLVIDEAQDMSEKEYALVRALMTANEEMRVIAVGDDDQNIFEFRGSDSRYMSQLLHDTTGRFVEMTENYRSSKNVVDFANTFVKGIKDRMKSVPIISMSLDDGFVAVMHHNSEYMYEPLVNDLTTHRRSGTTCVLTRTNEQAAILVALLRKRGMNSKLIQSLDGFRLINMAEVRHFLKYISGCITTPLIPDEVWEQSKHKTYSVYQNSESLHYLQKSIQAFEKVNKVKYYTDFKEFVFESSVEDFCDLTGADVVVSTIHKSKGREFDNVYMLIDALRHIQDSELRSYYVGMTRAKQSLLIHTNGTLFNRIPADRHYVDQNQYEMPSEVVLQLSLKDVNLGFFRNLKKEILALRAGNKLRFENNYLYHTPTNRCIGQLSKKMQEELCKWTEKGYQVADAKVRFIVAWRPKDAPKEENTAIILPDLILRKTSTTI